MQRVHCWPDWQLFYFVLSLQSVDLCLFQRLSPLGRRWRDGLGFDFVQRLDVLNTLDDMPKRANMMDLDLRRLLS